MCVDFHSHLRPAQTPVNTNNTSTDTETETNSQNSSYSSNALSKFTLSRDTSIINYCDANSAVAACVHHFTLYDIEARGFVRPFCLAYVSYDKTKPIVFFDKIRQKFNEITDLFKKSNFNLFKRELEQRILDLQFTRDLFLKWSSKCDDLKELRELLAREQGLDPATCVRLTSSSVDDVNIDLQLNAIDNLKSELECVLETIKSELKSKGWVMKLAYDSNEDLAKDDLTQSTRKSKRSMTFPLETTGAKVVKQPVVLKPRIFKNILIGK